MGSGASSTTTPSMDASSAALSAVRELQFEASGASRGRCLLELRDQLVAYGDFLSKLHQRFEIGQKGVNGFTALVRNLDGDDDALDEDMAASQYFETCGFPEDEDDPAQRSAITCSVAQLGAALTRLANMSWMMEHGEANVGLKEQLVAFLESRAPRIGTEWSTREAMENTRAALRDDAAYHAPKHFCGVHRVWLQLRWGDRAGGRVEIDVDADVDPDAAYNFVMLCSGELGSAPLSGVPLSYKGCPIHRVVQGAFLQSGDIEFGDGNGGDSVYGGAFNASARGLERGTFETPGIVAMGHLGDPSDQTSQFFITASPQPDLAGDHVVVGHVVKGLEHVVHACSGVVEIDPQFEDEGRPLHQQTVEIFDCGYAGAQTGA